MFNGPSDDLGCRVSVARESPQVNAQLHCILGLCLKISCREPRSIETTQEFVSLVQRPRRRPVPRSDWGPVPPEGLCPESKRVPRPRCSRIGGSKNAARRISRTAANRWIQVTDQRCQDKSQASGLKTNQYLTPGVAG